MKSKLTSGQVEVTLMVDEGRKEIFSLRPSLRAMTQVSRQYDGLAEARKQLVAENFDAVVFILRLGISQSDLESRGFKVADIGEMVYSNGVSADLLVALIRYVAILGNGGRPLDEEDDEPKADTDEGNVSALKSSRRNSSSSPQDG